jgi:aminopeptidase N
MSTYLVAFIISDFDRVESPDGKFRVWSKKESLEQTKYALKIGQQIQKYLEEYFKSPFPLPKQDLVAVPNFFFGMFYLNCLLRCINFEYCHFHGRFGGMENFGWFL